MAVPLNLLHINGGFLSANAFNANNALIEEALMNTIDRRGGNDNAMLADFDMGMYNIFNLKRATLNHEAVPFGQLVDFLKGSSKELTSLVEMEDRITAFAGQQHIPLQQITYVPTTNSLMVFVDGEYQRASHEYLETSGQSIQFVTPLNSGQLVDIFGSRYDAEQFVGLAIEAANSAQQDAASAEQSAIDAANSADIAAWAAGYKFDINNQTGETYYLTIDDAGDFVRMDNALENSVVVSSNAVVPFEVGTIILVRQVGEGTTKIVPTTGVTVNSPYASLSISDSDFGVALVKVDTDEWDLVKAFGGVDTDDLAAFNGEFDARLDDLFKELLSSNPTFVVNFKSLENALKAELASLIDRLDSLEEGEGGEESPLATKVNDLETELAGVQQAIDSLTGRVSALETGGGGGGSGDDFEFSEGEKGYQKLPSGLIFQWGTIGPIYRNVTKSETFKTSFPNTLMSLTLTPEYDTGWVGGNQDTLQPLELVTSNKTKTGFDVRFTGGDLSTTATIGYFAIGN